MSEKGLSQLPSPIKVFIISYAVLIAAGLLLSLWIALKSPMLRGPEFSEPTVITEEELQQYQPDLRESMRAEAEKQLEVAKETNFYEFMLKRAHIHHLGHILMVFSVAGIYAFVRAKNSTKIQIIVWTTIVTLIHTLAFLIYSRTLLVIFGSVYGILLAYMLIVIIIDCYRPVRE